MVKHYTNTGNPIDFPNMENIKAGADQQGDDDKDYQESTPEKYAEFVLKRNYHYTNTDNPIDFPKHEWDDWKPIEDIV